MDHVLAVLVGGFIFTGFALYATYRPQTAAPVPTPIQVPAE